MKVVKFKSWKTSKSHGQGHGIGRPGDVLFLFYLDLKRYIRMINKGWF